MKNRITLLVFLTILTLILTACYSGATASSDQDSEVLTSNRPDGWSEATHGKDAEPNYAVVFSDDKVNQITITISPENWEAMQANMTELFGEAGSGNGDRGMPGGEQPPIGDRPQPGAGNIPEDDQQPPIEGQPQLGEQGFPEGVEPPESGFPDPPEGFSPPENGDRPEFPDGVQQRGRPGGGGLRGGDMTPENPMWVTATIEFEGQTWTNVGVRYKGNSSLTSGWRSGTLKLPLKLDFDEFEDEYPEIDDQRFYGFKQLSLANGYKDSSFLRDAATSLILEEAGLPAAKTAFYEVILDYGEGPVSLGLYTMIEVIDDTAIEQYFGSDDGNIYEGDGPAASFAVSTYNQIEDSFEKENNEDEADWSDIENLFDVLHSDQRTSNPAAWRDELEAIFDVNGFLEWLAISSVIQNWDAYGSMSHNYYLYNNPDTGQLSWISWDHNEAMSSEIGGDGGPAGVRGPGNRSVSLDKVDINENWPLIRYLLDDPIYYELYLDYLEETVEDSFNPDRMSEIYQSMATLISPYAVADVGEKAFDDAVQQLIDHAYQRADAVEQFIDSTDR
jgi:spore coat protein CotH